MRWLTNLLGRALASWKSAQGLDSLAAGVGENTLASDGSAAELFRHPGRKLLHVGCGHATKSGTCPGFQSDDWLEIRLDIDPAVVPDVVCSMLDMAPVPTASVDAVYSSHNIEHLYSHEVPLALTEFLRVLKPNGFLLLTCPDLQSVCQLVAEDKLTKPAYTAPVGPIAPLDILYGHRPQLAAGNLFMAHHSGFTLTTLVQACKDAGFRSVIGFRNESCFDLWVLAMELPQTEETLHRLAAEFIPGAHRSAE